MGVLLLGLLGLASILGVASNNAQESLTTNQTVQLTSNLRENVRLTGLTGIINTQDFITGLDTRDDSATALASRFKIHVAGTPLPNAFLLGPLVFNFGGNAPSDGQWLRANRLSLLRRPVGFG